MNILPLFKNIKAFVFDVDGVMTNGQIHVLESGEHYRTYFVRDGYAIQKARDLNYYFCCITGGAHPGTIKRLEMLRFNQVIAGLGTKDKLEVFLEWLEKSGFEESEVIYMGDDLADLEILKREKLLSTCPADAVPEIQQVVKYISPSKGGEGAVRDVIEKVLKLNGQWPQ